MYSRLIDEASDGETTRTTLPTLPATNLMNWRSEVSQNFPLKTEYSFEPLCNPSNLIHHDAVINDSEDEPVLVEATSAED